MTANVGNADRILRLVLGVVIALLPFVTSMPLLAGTFAQIGSVAVGAILILTALFRFCPLYRIVGIKTCRM